MFFRPFSGLSGSNHPDIILSEILSLIEKEHYTLAEQRSKDLMTLSLEGLRYFQTYDWLFLRGTITAGYIGWCIFCLQFVIRNYVFASRPVVQMSIKSGILLDVFSVIVLSGLSSMLWIQKMPTMYYAYVFFPVFFWNRIIHNYRYLIEALNLCLRGGVANFFITITASLLFLQALVCSYFYREVLTAIFFVLAAWPLIMPRKIHRKHKSLVIGWSISCICTSVFTLLPVEKGENIVVV